MRSGLLELPYLAPTHFGRAGGNLNLLTCIFLDLFESDRLGLPCLALTHFGWVGGNLGLLKLPFLVNAVLLYFISYFLVFIDLDFHLRLGATRLLLY
jgi:hypothetical protein